MAGSGSLDALRREAAIPIFATWRVGEGRLLAAGLKSLTSVSESKTKANIDGRSLTVLASLRYTFSPLGKNVGAKRQGLFAKHLGLR